MTGARAEGSQRSVQLVWTYTVPLCNQQPLQCQVNSCINLCCYTCAVKIWDTQWRTTHPDLHVHVPSMLLATHVLLIMSLYQNHSRHLHTVMHAITSYHQLRGGLLVIRPYVSTWHYSPTRLLGIWPSGCWQPKFSLDCESLNTTTLQLTYPALPVLPTLWT